MPSFSAFFNHIAANSDLDFIKMLMSPAPIDPVTSETKTTEIAEGSVVHQSKPLDKPAVELVMKTGIDSIQSVLNMNDFKETVKVVFPAPNGPVVTIFKILYVPVNDYPGYNFVGRIIGPRGMTIKQLAHETGCFISIRGKGRDPRVPVNEEEEDLHVAIWCRDSKNICEIKMVNAVDHVMKLLIPTPGKDDMRERQLKKLALLSGTYRPRN